MKIPQEDIRLKLLLPRSPTNAHSTYVDLRSYPPENWQLLKLLWDYEHGDYYAVLEIDSLEPKYRLAVYKISSNVVAHGSQMIPTYVGFQRTSYQPPSHSLLTRSNDQQNLKSRRNQRFCDLSL